MAQKLVMFTLIYPIFLCFKKHEQKIDTALQLQPLVLTEWLWSLLARRLMNY